MAAEKIEKDALTILEGLESADGEEGSKKKVKANDIRILLLFYGVERKQQKKKTAGGLRLQYYDLKQKNVAPKAYKKWSEEDEAYLESLRNENISKEETESAMLSPRLDADVESEISAIKLPIFPAAFQPLIEIEFV